MVDRWVVAGVVHAGEVKLLLAEHVLDGRFRLFVHPGVGGTPLLKIEKEFERKCGANQEWNLRFCTRNGTRYTRHAAHGTRHATTEHGTQHAGSHARVSYVE